LTNGYYVHVKVLESNPIIRIWPFEHSLEHDKLVPRHETTTGAICNAEENSKLIPVNAGEVLFGSYGVNEGLSIEISSWTISFMSSYERLVAYFWPLTSFAYASKFRFHLLSSVSPEEAAFNTMFVAAEAVRATGD
jgi:hypothetical protein